MDFTVDEKDVKHWNLIGSRLKSDRIDVRLLGRYMTARIPFNHLLIDFSSDVTKFQMWKNFN